jgi:RNA polymerase sigma-70 factor (ECF subfamily)
MLTLAINRGPVNVNVNALTAMPKLPAAPTPAFAPARTVASDAEREQAAVRAVLAGDANAFQPLIEAHQSRVYSLALRMLGNEREAEDAAQDAFVHAYARLASYKPEWRFKTWIMTITSNLCIDRLRRRKLEPTSFTDYSYRAAADDDGEVEFVSHEPQPDAVIVRRQRDAAIRAMLNELPDDDRGMVALFYFNDQSYEDIAAAMNTTVSAVKSRLFRARQKMAQSKWAKALSA